jgi:RNA polymerase sigma-70 factor (ECF subfamily)
LHVFTARNLSQRRSITGKGWPTVLHERAALELFQSHRASLVDYARVITGNDSQAEDIVQDAWLRFARARANVAFREPLQYLYRIVRNLAIDRKRASRKHAERHTFTVDEIAKSLAADAPSPEAIALARSELQFVRLALAELPDRTRIAVEMHRFGGHTLSEIAGALNISVGLAHALVAEGIKHCHRRRNSVR